MQGLRSLGAVATTIRSVHEFLILKIIATLNTVVDSVTLFEK